MTTKINVEEPTGIVDGTNFIFQVDNKPAYITINGIQYFENDGYTVEKIVIRMVIPPAPLSTIRSIY